MTNFPFKFFYLLIDLLNSKNHGLMLERHGYGDVNIIDLYDLSLISNFNYDFFITLNGQSLNFFHVLFDTFPNIYCLF